jgi:hypothetical protein
VFQQGLENLPLELQFKIVKDSGLPVDSLLNLCKTNRALAELCRNDRLWKDLVRRDFPGIRKSIDYPKATTWRQVYEQSRNDPSLKLWRKLSTRLINLNQRGQLRWHPQNKVIPKKQRAQTILVSDFRRPYKIQCRQIKDEKVIATKNVGYVQPGTYSLEQLVKTMNHYCRIGLRNRRLRFRKEPRTIVVEAIHI